MKKCTAIIFYSVLFFLFSCSGKGKETVTTAPETDTIVVAPVIEQVPVDLNREDTIKINIKDSYESYDNEQVPTLTIDISLPVIKLNNAVATAKADSTLALIFGEYTTLEDACHRHVESFKQDFDDMHDEYINEKGNDGWSAFRFTREFFMDGEISVGYKNWVTYTAHIYEYCGGAHGLYITNIINFDPASGNVITLEDIFEEGYEEKLTTILRNQLMKDNNVSTIEELDDNGFLRDVFISQNFIPEKFSITFLYNPYEIACYAMGYIYVTLDYKSLEEIMK